MKNTARTILLTFLFLNQGHYLLAQNGSSGTKTYSHLVGFNPSDRITWVDWPDNHNPLYLGDDQDRTGVELFNHYFTINEKEKPFNSKSFHRRFQMEIKSSSKIPPTSQGYSALFEVDTKLNENENATYLSEPPLVALAKFFIQNSQSISGVIQSNLLPNLRFRGNFLPNETNTYKLPKGWTLTIEPIENSPSLLLKLSKDSQQKTSAIAHPHAHPHNLYKINNPSNLGELISDCSLNVKFSHNNPSIPQKYRGKAIASAKIKKLGTFYTTLWIIIPPNGKPTLASAQITNNYQIPLLSKNPKTGSFLTLIQLQQHLNNPFHPHINTELSETLWLHKENNKNFLSILSPEGSVILPDRKEHFGKTYKSAFLKYNSVFKIHNINSAEFFPDDEFGKYLQPFGEINLFAPEAPKEIQDLLNKYTIQYTFDYNKKISYLLLEKSPTHKSAFYWGYRGEKTLFEGKTIRHIPSEPDTDFIFEHIKNNPFAIKAITADKKFDELSDFEGLIELKSGQTYPIILKRRLPDKSFASESLYFRIEKPVIIPKPDSWPWIWTYKRHPEGRKFRISTFSEHDLSLCYIRPKELFPIQRINKVYPRFKPLHEYTEIVGNEVIKKSVFFKHSQPQPECSNLPPQDNDYTREVVFLTCINQARMDLGFHPIQVEPGLLRAARWTVHTKTVPEQDGIKNLTYEIRPRVGAPKSGFYTPVVMEDRYPDNFPAYDWRNFFCLNWGRDQNNFWTPDFYNECKFSIPEKITDRFQKLSYSSAKIFYMHMVDFYKSQMGIQATPVLPFNSGAIYRHSVPMFIGISTCIINKVLLGGRYSKDMYLEASSVTGFCKRSNPTGINEDYLLHKIYNLDPKNTSRAQKELNIHKFNSWVIRSTLEKPLDWKPSIEEWLQYENDQPSHPELDFLIKNNFFKIKLLLKGPVPIEYANDEYIPTTILIEDKEEEPN